jgi:DNA-binding FrmR family transcriptional regulator
MDISDQERTDITNRLKRARGQIDGVLGMIEEGRSCRDVVTQLGAASTAVERAALKIVAVGLKQCYLEGGDVDSMSAEEMEALLLSIA